MDLKNKALKLPDGDLYLETRYRIAAFRGKYPDGRFGTAIVKAGPGWSVVKAEVFASPRDEKCLAEAYSFRRQAVDLENYLEAAETAAIGRALEELGFGLPAEEVAEARKTAKDDAALYAALAKDTAGDEPKRYLPAKTRVALWRERNPEGFIKKELLALDDRHVVVKVTVLSDGEHPSVTAHAQRWLREGAVAGEFFLEAAETAAIGRAMSLLGYDLPPEDGNASNIADEPIVSDVPEWAIPADGGGAVPKAFMGLADGPQAPKNDGDTVPTWAGGTATAGAPDRSGDGFWPGQASADTEVPERAEAAEEPADTAEPVRAVAPVKVNAGEAAERPFPFGKYEGKTLGELASTAAGALFLRQVVAVYRGDEELTAAIEAVLEAFGG